MNFVLPAVVLLFVCIFSTNFLTAHHQRLANTNLVAPTSHNAHAHNGTYSPSPAIVAHSQLAAFQCTGPKTCYVDSGASDTVEKFESNLEQLDYSALPISYDTPNGKVYSTARGYKRFHTFVTGAWRAELDRAGVCIRSSS